MVGVIAFRSRLCRSFTRMWARRARINPGCRACDLGGGKRVGPKGHTRLQFSLEHQHQPALTAFARNNGWTMASTLQQSFIRLHHKPACLRGTVVTRHAFLLQNRLDLGGVASWNGRRLRLRLEGTAGDDSEN